MSFIKKISFLLVYLLLPLPFLGYAAGGWWSFLPFYILFAGIPLMDWWLRDSSNPSDEQEQFLTQDPYFQGIIYLYVPIQIIFLISALCVINIYSLSWYEWLGFALSIGLITGGVGINLAHELMHKKAALPQFLSKTLLVMVCYGHFIIEHVRGHHLRVATPEDPASARLGESLYQFLPRTVVGSFASAWHLERQRLKQKNRSFSSVHNQFYWILGIPALIITGCAILGGAQTVAFFLLQSFTAILMLEMVNYIEHYGLQRKKLPTGYYEKVSINHSWNANHWLSNMLLFHLQRHSDHHACGARPYQILRHQAASPQLPSGYLGMLCIAIFPPLWRAIMDKRVLKYQTAQPKDNI